MSSQHSDSALAPTLTQLLANKQETRKQKKRTSAELAASSWESFDATKAKFSFTELKDSKAHAKLNFPAGAKKIDIFLKIVDEPLINAMFGDDSRMFLLARNMENQEVLVHVWDTNADIGKKFCLSNAFTYSTTRSKQHLIPIYDAYKFMFSLCDHFNRGLHKRTWPFRHGGGTSYGDSAAIDDFHFSCIVQNVLNAHACLRLTPSRDIDFFEDCSSLADEIFSYSLSL